MGLLSRLRAVGRFGTRSGEAIREAPERAALHLVEEGNGAERSGRVDEAMRCYEAAIRMAPNLARAHLSRGNLLLDSGDVDGALRAYTTARSHDPRYAAAHYNLGNAYARLNRIEDAQAAYVHAVALNPDLADAHVALGGLLEDSGKLEEAVSRYGQALVLKPDYAEVYCNLGSVLRRLGRHTEALSSLHRAVAINPDLAMGHLHLARALHDHGERGAAAASYREALRIKPDLASASFGLGESLSALGQFDEAIDAYRAGLTIEPDATVVHNILGNLLQGRRRFDEAGASYERALALEPENAELLGNLGNALHESGRLADALTILCRAVEFNPNIAFVHFNLGRVRYDLGMLHDAVASFRRAIELGPTSADAHLNLGNALYGLGQLVEALACYRHVLELDPAYALAHNNIANVLKDLGHLDEAATSLGRALAINPELAMARSNLLFLHNFDADYDPKRALQEARDFGECATRSSSVFTAWSNEPAPDRRLRIGFVSADLRMHAVGFFAEGALAALVAEASDRLELFAYYNHRTSDTVTERIKASCAGWCSTASLSDEQLAHRVRDDRIDILIDLSGHTAGNRLSAFAWKPAPVQASWLGYFATTGVAAIDYLIADPWTLPESEECHFTEQILRLPRTRLCFTPPNESIGVGPLPAIANGGCITFGCFNTLAKMNDDVVETWACVLTSVPESRLFLKAKQLSEPTLRQAVVDRFAARGIGADRLILEGAAPRAQYLAAYQRVDMALDPFPYPGGTTTAESLWMGVPVLTLSGDRFLSRQGHGLLVNAGLAEWVAADREDYVAQAIERASDLERLASLRISLRSRVLASPLFDARIFAHDLQSALRAVWHDWCRRQTSVIPG